MKTKERIDERLERLERRLSFGDTSSHDFEELGVLQKLETIHSELHELRAAVNDLEHLSQE